MSFEYKHLVLLFNLYYIPSDFGTGSHYSEACSVGIVETVDSSSYYSAAGSQEAEHLR